ncbi:hypothetical protein HYDPIDRAFT_29072 [Hydnomerulius pinastri MD-312]|uniref:Uncharacterized protein n=1 Tax=Hydnomerulius pinastri MD-312 TaxID=994086 RepID=A0A0C9VZ93_9AGAM|nr:hypothetical protein HYDPIDRAFT_29072 [Hydnomerulius pinastri MD-312]
MSTPTNTNTAAGTDPKQYSVQQCQMQIFYHWARIKEALTGGAPANQLEQFKQDLLEEAQMAMWFAKHYSNTSLQLLVLVWSVIARLHQKSLEQMSAVALADFRDDDPICDGTGWTPFLKHNTELSHDIDVGPAVTQWWIKYHRANDVVVVRRVLSRKRMLPSEEDTAEQANKEPAQGRRQRREKMLERGKGKGKGKEVEATTDDKGAKPVQPQHSSSRVSKRRKHSSSRAPKSAVPTPNLAELRSSKETINLSRAALSAVVAKTVGWGGTPRMPLQTPGVEGAIVGPTIHHAAAAAVRLDDIEMELDSVDAATAELQHTITEQKKAIQNWTVGNKALSIKQSSAYQSKDKLDKMVNSIQWRLKAVLVRNANLRTLITSGERWISSEQPLA